MDQIDPETGLNTFTGPSNRVTILNPDGSGNLDQIGLVDGIADGERIWSARFIGDRGYLVTFETIDPLWVLDLSDPYEPVILGELEVPGVSTYIHPVNENTLLTIGIGPGEGGLGLDWSTTQVSLFDVSDPTNPTLADSMKLTPAYSDSQCEDIRYCGWTWSWSEATYEHKAFTFWPPDSILAVPLSTYRYVYDEDGYSGYEYVSVLKMIDIDTENLSLGSHGEIDPPHSTTMRTETQLGGTATQLAYEDPFSWVILSTPSLPWAFRYTVQRTFRPLKLYLSPAKKTRLAKKWKNQRMQIPQIMIVKEALVTSAKIR